MAFNNEIFPYYPMKHEMSRSTIDPVVVSTNGTYEYRVKRQRWERFLWKLPTQTMKADQKEAIRTFLASRGHGLNSFKFTDPDYSTLDNAVLQYHNAQNWKLALPIDDNTPGDHPIFNPDVNSLTVTINGSPTTIDSFDVVDGIPCIKLNSTTGTEVVRVSGNIYFTVRLNNNYNQVYTALDSTNKPLGLTISEIELIEVYGEY